MQLSRPSSHRDFRWLFLLDYAVVCPLAWLLRKTPLFFREYVDNFAGQLQQAVRVFHDCGLSTDINPAFFSFALHILHGNCEMNPLHVKAPTSAAFSACFCVRCRTGRRIHTPKLVINNCRHHRSAAESSSRKKIPAQKELLTGCGFSSVLDGDRHAAELTECFTYVSV